MKKATLGTAKPAPADAKLNQDNQVKDMFAGT
jgi:hypothetical protein